jgi:hypothetical protein
MQSQGTDSSSSRFDPAQRLSPTAFEQNATMKDSSVQENPSLLKVGVSRDKITAAFGTPNQIRNQGGKEQERLRGQPGWFKIRQAENLRAQYCGRSRAGSRRSYTRPESITPNSSSPFTISPMDPMAPYSQFKKESRADTTHDGDAQD